MLHVEQNAKEFSHGEHILLPVFPGSGKEYELQAIEHVFPVTLIKYPNLQVEH
jgi:hypothetical protein